MAKYVYYTGIGARPGYMHTPSEYLRLVRRLAKMHGVKIVTMSDALEYGGSMPVTVDKK